MQEPPGISEVPQLFVCKNSLASDMLVMFIAITPELVSVTSLGVAVKVRSSCPPKLISTGLTEAIATGFGVIVNC